MAHGVERENALCGDSWAFLRVAALQKAPCCCEPHKHPYSFLVARHRELSQGSTLGFVLIGPPRLLLGLLSLFCRASFCESYPAHPIFPFFFFQDVWRCVRF